MAEDPVAKRGDWKTNPMPDHYLYMEILECEQAFTAEEMTRIQRGIVPRDPQDQWFMFYEDEWLHCHRRETGNCIYQARFELVDGGWYLISKLRVNNDPEQYTPVENAFGDDHELLLVLLMHLFGNRP